MAGWTTFRGLGQSPALRTERPVPPLTLAQEEREVLEGWARRRTTAPALAQRARAILACAAGKTNAEVARELGWAKRRVGQWRSRFLAARLDGVLDEPRLGAPRRITDAQVDRVVTLTLESKPPDATHWSAPAMAACCGLSPGTVSRIWRMSGLQPRRTGTFKFSGASLSCAKVGDFVGLYLDPRERAFALCVDETLPGQAVDRAQPVAPVRTGQVGRRTQDHVRRVTASLFAALDARSAFIGRCHPRGLQFRKFLETADTVVPQDLDVHLIVAGNGEGAVIGQWSTRRPRYHVHVVSTRAEWLRLAERWFARLTLRQMHLGAHCSTRALEAAIGEYIARATGGSRPFVWTATTAELLSSVERTPPPGART